jgi:predicted signal transduction protein with EAL and GGDEF domain
MLLGLLLLYVWRQDRIQALAWCGAAYVVGGCDVAATVSVGVASGAPGTDIASLLIRSDGALYRAKAMGRNRLEIAREEIPTIFTTAPAQRQDRLVEVVA